MNLKINKNSKKLLSDDGQETDNKGFGRRRF